MAVCGTWGLIDSVMAGESVGIILLFILITGIALLGMIRLSIQCWMFENRKFALSKEGIALGDGQKPFYRWDEVYEVAVAAFGASASLQNYQTVICCFLKPRTVDFSHKILRSYLYGIRHQDAFVIVDYSPAMIEKFSAVYPGIISDYREEQIKA